MIVLHSIMNHLLNHRRQLGRCSTLHPHVGFLWYETNPLVVLLRVLHQSFFNCILPMPPDWSLSLYGGTLAMTIPHLSLNLGTVSARNRKHCPPLSGHHRRRSELSSVGRKETKVFFFTVRRTLPDGLRGTDSTQAKHKTVGTSNITLECIGC